MEDSIRSKIHTLLETSRYNKSILPDLVDALRSQVADGWYDIEINLAILKLYQFHPEEGVVDLDVLSKILVKALMNLPSPDFQMCMYLVPEKYQQAEVVRNLISVAQKLEAAKFKDVWEQTKASPEILTYVPGFEDAIRGFMIQTISLTFGEIPVDVLGELVALKGSQLDDVMTKNSIKYSGGVAYFPKTEENQSKPTKFEETLQLSQFSAVLSTLAK